MPLRLGGSPTLRLAARLGWGRADRSRRSYVALNEQSLATKRPWWPGASPAWSSDRKLLRAKGSLSITSLLLPASGGSSASYAASQLTSRGRSLNLLSCGWPRVPSEDISLIGPEGSPCRACGARFAQISDPPKDGELRSHGGANPSAVKLSINTISPLRSVTRIVQTGDCQNSGVSSRSIAASHPPHEALMIPAQNAPPSMTSPRSPPLLWQARFWQVNQHRRKLQRRPGGQ